MDTRNPQETTTMALATPAVPVPPEVLEQVLIGGDLSKLTAAQRADYYGAVCRSLGLNPLTKPFEYLNLNGKLRLYALRHCADQLRRLHGISISIVSRERLGDIYLVTARATDRHGRTDESMGAVALGTLKGDALANALMKTETKAKRRVTLSLAGLGWLDETELATIPGVQVGEPPAIAAPDQEGEDETAQPPMNGHSHGRLPPEARMSQDDARTLKQLAQQAFGFAEGERRLKADLGFEPDERTTLRHLAATAARWSSLAELPAVCRKSSTIVDTPPPQVVIPSRAPGLLQENLKFVRRIELPFGITHLIPVLTESALGGQVHGLGLASGRPRDRHQPLRFEGRQAGAQVALVVAPCHQGPHQVLMVRGHGHPGESDVCGRLSTRVVATILPPGPATQRQGRRPCPCGR